jgi:hypothetical protein
MTKRNIVSEKLAIEPSRKRKRPELFRNILATLTEFGYRGEQVRKGNCHYWLYFFGGVPFFYARGWAVYIDFAHAELKDVLSTVKGIVPPAGATIQSKFEHFHFRRAILKKDNSIHTEYEAWRFEFIDQAAFEAFLNICNQFVKGGLESAKEAAATYQLKVLPNTTKSIISESRVGQQKFKKGLLKYWKTCAVTGCTVSSILKASHIKAWAISSPIERLDPFNGLLLNPNLDALFDSGLITFDDDGLLIISPVLSHQDIASLGLTVGMKLRKVNGAHKSYLMHHRENIFRKEA